MVAPRFVRRSDVLFVGFDHRILGINDGEYFVSIHATGEQTLGLHEFRAQFGERSILLIQVACS